VSSVLWFSESWLSGIFEARPANESLVGGCHDDFRMSKLLRDASTQRPGNSRLCPSCGIEVCYQDYGRIILISTLPLLLIALRFWGVEAGRIGDLSGRNHLTGTLFSFVRVGETLLNPSGTPLDVSQHQRITLDDIENIH
jgi:hypothetical protein